MDEEVSFKKPVNPTRQLKEGQIVSIFKKSVWSKESFKKKFFFSEPTAWNSELEFWNY